MDKRLATTKLKACRNAGYKGELLSHGAGDYSVGGVFIHIYGCDEIGYTCDYEVAKDLDLLMVR